MNPRIAAKQKIVTDAVDNLFGDMSVSPAVTLEALEEIQSDVESKIDALKADIKHKGGGT
jgi:hypothetical protein